MSLISQIMEEFNRQFSLEEERGGTSCNSAHGMGEVYFPDCNPEETTHFWVNSMIKILEDLKYEKGTIHKYWCVLKDVVNKEKEIYNTKIDERITELKTYL